LNAQSGQAFSIADWRKEHDLLGESRVVFGDTAGADEVAQTNLSAIL
jgi:hypothetical protein